MKGFYFPHDYDARADIKIANLLRQHGMCGYGIYWALVEDLYRGDNHVPYDIDFLAWHYRVGDEVVKAVIHDFDLFVVTDGVISSNAVEQRLNLRKEKSEKARQSALHRYGQANAKQTQSGRHANKVKESKVKEKKSIVKKSKAKVIKEPPTEAQVVEYFVEHGYTQQAGRKAFTYYATNDWKDAQGRPVQNWKQKMIGVWFKPENAAQQSQATNRAADILNELNKHDAHN